MLLGYVGLIRSSDQLLTLPELISEVFLHLESLLLGNCPTIEQLSIIAFADLFL